MGAIRGIAISVVRKGIIVILGIMSFDAVVRVLATVFRVMAVVDLVPFITLSKNAKRDGTNEVLVNSRPCRRPLGRPP